MKRSLVSLLALFGMGVSYAQTPGGVGTPVIWLKTIPSSQDLDGNYEVVNSGAEAMKVYDIDGKVLPSVSRENVNTYNFNPAYPLGHDETDQYEIPVKGGDLSQSTVIGVWGYKQPDNAIDQCLFRIEAPKGEGRMMSRSELFYADGSEKETFSYSGFISKATEYNKKDDEKRVKIVSYVSASQPDHSLWGKSLQSTKFDLGKVKGRKGDKSTYAEVETPDNFSTISYMPELLVYNRFLCESERLRVESYLAMKYGITLNNSYLSSWSDIIFESGNGYFNRVFAVGRDDVSGFYQTQSTSAYQENVYAYDDTYDKGVSSKGLSGCQNLLTVGYQPGADGSYAITDGNLILLGDNNESTKPKDQLAENATPEEKAAYEGSYHHMGRVWKVKRVSKAGAFDDVKNYLELGYEMTEDGIFGQYRNKKIYLMIDRSNTGNFNEEPILMSALDESRMKAIFSDVDLFGDPQNEEVLITFAYKGVAEEYEWSDYAQKLLLEGTGETAEWKTQSKSDPKTREGIDNPYVEDVDKSAFTWMMYPNKEAVHGFTVRLQMDEPEPASVLVFNVSGNMVAEKRVNASGGVGECDINVPVGGVYIVKLITERSRNEFSGKILVR